MNTLIKNGQSVISDGTQHKQVKRNLNPNRTTTSILIRLESEKNAEGKEEKDNVSNDANSNLNDSTSTKDSLVKKIQARDQIDIIKEASKIIRERGKNNGSSLNAKPKSKADYLGHNREICLKNYLIDLLKDKRTEINDKELAITKALKESENRLEKDFKDFLSFVEREKFKVKEQEQEYLKIKNGNDSNKKNEKMLLNENKLIIADLERKVKDILGYKSLAIFVHSAVGVPFEFNNDVESEIKMIEQRDKERHIELITNKLIEDFFKVDLEDYYPEFLDDMTHLTGKFLELEEIALKMIEKKHIMDKELKMMDENHKDELEELSKRETAVKEEKMKLLRERDKDSKTLTMLKTLNFEGDSKEYLGYIYDLLNENSYMSENLLLTRSKKKNENVNYVKELIDILREKEFQIINYIAEMEKMEQEDETLVRTLINKRKEKNKETKQRMKMEAQSHLITLKMQKAEERSHRIVIKGRKVMSRNPIHKGTKRQKLKTNMNKQNDESMLFFDTDNF